MGFTLLFTAFACVGWGAAGCLYFLWRDARHCARFYKIIASERQNVINYERKMQQVNLHDFIKSLNNHWKEVERLASKK